MAFDRFINGLYNQGALSEKKHKDVQTWSRQSSGAPVIWILIEILKYIYLVFNKLSNY